MMSNLDESAAFCCEMMVSGVGNKLNPCSKNGTLSGAECCCIHEASYIDCTDSCWGQGSSKSKALRFQGPKSSLVLWSFCATCFRLQAAAVTTEVTPWQPKMLGNFAWYDNMMHYTFLAWVVSWKQLQYPCLRQVCQAPLSGNMAHGSTKEELWRAKGTSGFSAFIKKEDIWIWIQIWHDSHLGTLIVGGSCFFGGIGRVLMTSHACQLQLVEKN